jgi:transcriptional regulator with XRE-family HTH domain
MEFENYLKKWKDECKVKNKTLASLMGISMRQVSRIFNGHSCPSWRLLLLIRRMTGLSWDKIMQSIFNTKRIESLNKENKKKTQLKTEFELDNEKDMFSTLKGRIEVFETIFEFQKNNPMAYRKTRA